ncbi:hypothetical protein [uncultured Bradyrhizobium sp.]|uniref:hypothetical protein n=1 Tax=uncultured Bradyrhizobium sp. TaxID=199684 RepID=UPI0035CB5757
MLSRALSLATVMLLIGGFAAVPVRAQNLEAGKSPSQIFSGTCTACHKGARGLLKTVAPGSLPGYLRQHYTTSSEMASVLSAYLISNGATDTRYIGSQPKQHPKDAKQESGPPTQLDRFGRPLRRAPPQEAARPDGDGRLPQTEPEGRMGRSRPANPDAGKPSEGQTPAAAVNERGPDGRRLSAKQRLSKRGKPGEELPKTDASKDTSKDMPTDEAAKGEGAKPDKDSKPTDDTAKDEGGKPDAKPAEQGKSESAKLDADKGEGAKADIPLRADPVPAVTPAPKSPEGDAKPVQAPAPAAAGGTPASSASNAVPEAPANVPAAPVAPSASVVAPVTPAGPPVPPISQ